jgi:hypothetical protein
MVFLAAHSNASFLTEPGSCSHAGAYIFLSNDDPIPRLNGSVLAISHIIKYDMASAAEAELAALYITAQEMIPLHNALIKMGWPQPKSSIQTDNSTTHGFIQDTIVQRRIKMIWMRLHWLCCRAAQGQFRFYWDKGSMNMADYHTKHHPPAYHLAHRPTHAGLANTAMAAGVCSLVWQMDRPYNHCHPFSNGHSRSSIGNTCLDVARAPNS